MTWAEFDPRGKSDATAKQKEELRQFHLLCGRVFGTEDGARLLATLRRGIKEITAGPDASHGALLWHEGRRHLLGQMETWTANGLNEPVSDLRDRLDTLPTGRVGGTGEPSRPAPARRGVGGVFARWFGRRLGG